MRPAEEYVCTQCGATMRCWQEMPEYQHGCGGLVKLRIEIENEQLTTEVKRLRDLTYRLEAEVHGQETKVRRELRLTKAERDQLKSDRDFAVGELARVQASAKFTQDQRCQVIEMRHDLINRALMNEKYCAENDLPNYSTSHRLQESALRALLDERDRLADRVWQLEKALALDRTGYKS